MIGVTDGRMSKGLRVLAAGVLGALLLAAGGCNNELKDTNAKLMQENQQLRDENASLQQNNSQLQSQNAQLLTDVQNMRTAPPPSPMADTAMRGDAGVVTPQGDVVLTVAGDVSFTSGQATLTAAGRRELDRIASRIRSQYASNRIRVEGYTDRHPIRKSKWGSNEALSAARAAAVEQYLIQKGISGSRIESVGKGSSNLKSTDAASRRVEIVILGG